MSKFFSTLCMTSQSGGLLLLEHKKFLKGISKKSTVQYVYSSSRQNKMWPHFSLYAPIYSSAGGTTTEPGLACSYVKFETFNLENTTLVVVKGYIAVTFENKWAGTKMPDTRVPNTAYMTPSTTQFLDLCIYVAIKTSKDNSYSKTLRVKLFNYLA